MNENKNRLLHESVDKIYYKYLLNSVLGMLSVSFCILVDTMFVGRGIGSEGLAALNICIPVFNLFNGIGLLFGMGGATSLSINIGKGELNEAKKVFTQTILVAIVVGVSISILFSIYKESIGYMLGADENTIDMVVSYLGGVFMFGFSYILSHTISSFVRNDHNPRLAMIATSVAGLVNIILDYIFIFEFGIGMLGAALATSIASVTNVLILCTHFMRKKCTLKLMWDRFNINRLIRVLKNGAPSFTIELSSGIVIFIFNLSLLRMIGEIGVSAYSIIANVSLVVSAIYTGIAQAIQPIISMNFGANKYERVEIVKKKGLKTAFIVGIIFYVTGVLFPENIVSIFTSEKGEIVDITVNAINYYFVSFLIMGINIVMGAYYQAREYTALSNMISLGRGIIFLIIGIMTLPYIFGVDGIWFTVVFAEVSTLICTYIYIGYKKYKRV